MRVLKRENLNVLCSWELVGSISGGPLELTIEIGWSSTDTHETSESVTREFSYASETGFEFEGFSSMSTISSSVSQTLEHSEKLVRTIDAIIQMVEELLCISGR